MNVERNAVARGAALLDQKYPGWQDCITIPIDVTTQKTDAVGQVYVDWDRGCIVLFEHVLDGFDPIMIEHGMNAPWDADRLVWNADCLLLNTWWAEEVEARR